MAKAGRNKGKWGLYALCDAFYGGLAGKIARKVDSAQPNCYC